MQTGLRPQCIARCVVDLHQAEEAVVNLCQTWGGGGNPLVPIRDGSPADYLQEQLVVAEVDGYTTNNIVSDASLPFMEANGAWDYGGTRSRSRGA